MSCFAELKTPAEERALWHADAPRSMNARTYQALEPLDRCTCSECSWRGTVYDLRWPRHLSERLAEGEPMWAGDCPRCDALVNSELQLAEWEIERQAKAAGGAMLAALVLAEGRLEDETPSWLKEMIRAAIAQAQAAGIKEP